MECVERSRGNGTGGKSRKLITCSLSAYMTLRTYTMESETGGLLLHARVRIIREMEREN